MAKTKVSTIEIDNKLNGQTINLLPFLPPGNAYVFVIGSDQLPVFHLWGKWKELLEKMPFLVFPRYGFPTEPVYPNMTLLHSDLLVVSNISSTKIRERVSLGLPIDEFVPKGVGEYIDKHNLYRTNTTI
jgi:nicotinate-nucleotide adenylyltransferase